MTVNSVTPARHLKTVALFILALMAAGCSTLFESREARERDELRLERIAIMESIRWPDGYEIVEVDEVVATLTAEAGPLGTGGSGYYGYLLKGPEGSTPTNWHTDIHNTLINTGKFEPWSAGVPNDRSDCEAARSLREFLHVDTGDILTLLVTPATVGGPIDLKLDYATDGSPTFPEHMRIARPGAPCQ